MNIFQGKTALITGASGGIGEAFARELARRGATLILVARGGEKLRALADELTRAHPIRAEVVACDLSQPGATEHLQEEVARRGLTLDLLINNAGFGTFGLFGSVPAKRAREQMMVDVVALVDLTSAFLPELLRQRGGVINLASTAAFQPAPN